MNMMGISETSQIAERMKRHLLEEYQNALEKVGIARGEMLYTEVVACESEIHNAAWKIAARLVEACNTSELVARGRGKTIAQLQGTP